MSTYENMTGTMAAAHAVRLACVDVTAAYPITPQTKIIEAIAEFIANGEMVGRFIQVESEQSALAATIAASSNGVRAFTATSSQGLLYMHEMMHWAAAARVPVVMANVNRAVAPPWNIYGDHQDAISQRDTGWIQLYAETNQDALDLILQAFRIAEDARVRLPVMVNLDGFTLSHTFEPVLVPSAEQVAAFLPQFVEDRWLDPNQPRTINGVVSPEHYIQFRALQRDASFAARYAIHETAEAFETTFGRPAGDLISVEQIEGATTVFVAMGSIASTIRGQAREWRANGQPVGLLSIRSYRPLPSEEVSKALRGAKSVVVWDRAYSYGCGGPLASEVRSSLYRLAARPRVLSAIAGLGGAPIGPDELDCALAWVQQGESEEQERWFGVKPHRSRREQNA